MVEEASICPECGKQSIFMHSVVKKTGQTYNDMVSGHGIHWMYDCVRCGTEYEVRYTDGMKIVVKSYDPNDDGGSEAFIDASEKADKRYWDSVIEW